MLRDETAPAFIGSIDRFSTLYFETLVMRHSTKYIKRESFFPLFNTSVLQLWRGSLFSVLFKKWKEKKNRRLSLASYNCL